MEFIFRKIYLNSKLQVWIETVLCLVMCGMIIVIGNKIRIHTNIELYWISLIYPHHYNNYY